MLGNDPIYQYDEDCVFSGEWGDYSQTHLAPELLTMEPISACGKDPAWVDWYIDNFKTNCLSFGYTQAGQENSFGWDNMREGYQRQLETINRKRGKGGDKGRDFGGYRQVVQDELF